MNKFGGIKWFFRKNLFSVFLSIFVILLSLFDVYIYINFISSNNSNSDISDDFESSNEAEEDEEVITYFVDIKGEVNNPGTYEVLPDTRVLDVIEKAGGLTENANTSVNNLSLKVKDEMVIIIYSNEEVSNFSKVKEKESQVSKTCNSSDIKNDTCISNDSLSSLVNINTASKEELMTLTGIGEAKALDIISYRVNNGLFNDISDITKVSGIGDSLYAKIKDFITT